MKSKIKLIIAILISIFIIGCTVIMLNKKSDIKVTPTVEPKISVKDSIK